MKKLIFHIPELICVPTILTTIAVECSPVVSPEETSVCHYGLGWLCALSETMEIIPCAPQKLLFSVFHGSLSVSYWNGEGTRT